MLYELPLRNRNECIETISNFYIFESRKQKKANLGYGVKTNNNRTGFKYIK